MVTTRTDQIDEPLGDIVAPRREVPRLLPGLELPAYRFVPGVHPHPVRDPRGHSYRKAARPERHGPWDPARWETLEAWKHGVDLFNEFYFWEAHEAWEGLWAAKQRENSEKVFLQGLIQVAAAMLKIHMRSLSGAVTLSNDGLEKLKKVSIRFESFMGLDLVQVGSAFHQYFRPLAERVLPRLDASVPVLELATRRG